MAVVNSTLAVEGEGLIVASWINLNEENDGGEGSVYLSKHIITYQPIHKSKRKGEHSRNLTMDLLCQVP